MKKFHIVLLFLLILLGIFSIIGFAAKDTLDIIKIGLQYPKDENSPKADDVLVKSSTGFELGELLDLVYIKHFDVSGLGEFTLKSDQLYHAVIGPFADYETASGVLNQNLQNAFIVKGKEIYIYSYGFATANEAQNKANEYAGLAYPTFVTNPNDQLILVISGVSKLGFLSNEGDFILTPLNSNLENSSFEFNGVNYRGGIGVKNQYLNDLSIINYVRMHEYLYGVVPREMSKSWPVEALKAQAVVARNYAIVNQNKFMDYGFNLDNTVSSQVYGGFDWEGDLSNQAVDSTKGLALYHGDILVSGYYHSNSGGYTENSENVWSTPLPYIKGVYDPFSTSDTYDLVYTADMIEKRLLSAGHNIGNLINFVISEYSVNNRVLNARFEGSLGTADLPKETIRKVFGYNEIRSTLLTVEPDNTVTLTNGLEFVNKAPNQLSILSGNNTVTTTSQPLIVSDGQEEVSYNYQSNSYRVSGSGWGHGLGMSQWGAKTMAEQGYSFEEILVFYYQGTHIE